jgi:branched-chain amino acid transport system ATP-binding protein
MREVTAASPAVSTLSTPAMLSVAALTVRYGGHTALSDFSFDIRSGQVGAIIGPNGSGKTTCLNAMTGAVPYTAGDIAVDGNPVPRVTPRRMFDLGVTRTFQNLDLIDELTAGENIGMGARPKTRAGFAEALLGAPRTQSERRQRREAARVAADRLGITAYLDVGVGDLPYGIRRRTEVARSLASAPRVLLLDEPTAGMGPGESADLAEAVARLAQELQIAIVIIEHDMRVVRAAADFVWVLGMGKLIAQGAPSAVLDQDIVVETYLGTREDL